MNSPHIVVPLLIAAFGGAWWIRGKMAKAEVEGVKAQNDALKERITLAQEGERAVTKHSQELTSQITTLKAQLDSRASLESLSTTTSVISSTAFQVVAANREIELALRLPLPHEPGTRYRIRGPLGDILVDQDAPANKKT